MSLRRAVGLKTKPLWAHVDKSMLRERAAIYTAYMVIVLASRVTSWPISLIHVDEYAFILAGREVLQGHLPYTTLFDIKPVGPSVTLALVMGIFGQHLLPVRIFGATCVLTASILLYETVRMWSPRRGEAAAVGVIYAASTVLFSGLATMTEIMVAPFSCLGAFLLSHYWRARERPRGGVAFSAGLAFGLATLMKTVPAVPGVWLALVAMITSFAWYGTYGRAVTQGLLFLAGLAAPTIVAAITFAAAGHFAEFTYANYGFMRVYAHADSLSTTLMHAAVISVEAWPFTLLAAIGLVADVRRLIRRAPVDALAVAAYAWLVGELVAAIGPLRLTDHYFLMVLPPLSVLATRTLVDLTLSWTQPPRSGLRALGAATAFVALVPIIPAVRNSGVALLKFPDTQRETSELVRRFQVQHDRSLLVLSYDLLADYLFVGAPLPYRIAIPVHLFGGQTALIGPDPVAEIDRAFTTKPRLVLLDWTDLDQLATKSEQDAVRAQLAQSYREVASHDERWSITGGGTYHLADIHLFERNDSE